MFNWPISVLGDWKDMSIAHVIITIKSEVSTFPIIIIFFRGWVPEMFVTSYSVTNCIYVPGKPGICLILLLCSSWWVQKQYTNSLSSLCKFIWRHSTYKMPVRYILSSVRVRLSISSPLSSIQHVGLHVFSLPAVCLSIFL